MTASIVPFPPSAYPGADPLMAGAPDGPAPDVSVAVDALAARCAALRADDSWAVETAGALIEAALEAAAADLHIELSPVGLRFRMQAAGHLTPAKALPLPGPAFGPMLVARLKVLARVPAYVLHEPQDGRIDWTGNHPETVSIRAAFLPMPGGCLASLRFPLRAAGNHTGHCVALRLDQLGMAPPVRAVTLELLSQRDGLLALTGPAGSGKTTTLHALLDHLHREHAGQLQMIAIEDPVERQLPFVSHVQVHPATGLDFPVAARAALRHSPDVLLIGELRDPETTTVALGAGMSGHLVMTTVHAGRAGRVPARLRALGAPLHLVAGAFNGAIAQRLVPRPPGSIPARLALFEACQTDEPARTLLAQADTFNAAIDHIARSISPTLESQAGSMMGSGQIDPAHARRALSDILPRHSPEA